MSQKRGMGQVASGELIGVGVLVVIGVALLGRAPKKQHAVSSSVG